MIFFILFIFSFTLLSLYRFAGLMSRPICKIPFVLFAGEAGRADFWAKPKEIIVGRAFLPAAAFQAAITASPIRRKAAARWAPAPSSFELLSKCNRSATTGRGGLFVFGAPAYHAPYSGRVGLAGTGTRKRTRHTRMNFEVHPAPAFLPLSGGSTSPTHRNPLLLFRLAGSFLLRLDTRAFRASLFQEPPRSASAPLPWVPVYR